MIVCLFLTCNLRQEATGKYGLLQHHGDHRAVHVVSLQSRDIMSSESPNLAKSGIGLRIIEGPNLVTLLFALKTNRVPLLCEELCFIATLLDIYGVVELFKSAARA